MTTNNQASGAVHIDSPAADQPVDAQQALFSAVITPHRSLSPSGFLIVMALFGGVSFIAGMVFLSMGAWPVFGFFGLDVALVYIAFRANYRSARAHETVMLTHDALVIRRVDQRGRVDETTLNPYWARLSAKTDEEFGMLALRILGQGGETPLGDCLSPPERVELHKALSDALHRAKQAPAGTA
ncbi:MAG: DUF2244 domain-containing protein [Pseudomonadota bacterium]